MQTKTRNSFWLHVFECVCTVQISVIIYTSVEMVVVIWNLLSGARIVFHQSVVIITSDFAFARLALSHWEVCI